MKNLIRKAIDKAGFTIFRNGALPVGTDYRKTLRRLYGDQLRIVFDVGANVGQFCIACNEILTQSKIYSFEPVHTTFETLKSNTGHIPNIQCFPLGLGDEPRKVEMFLRDLSTINSISAQLNVRTSETQASQIIDVTTLDLFCAAQKIDAIDLLKVDVEGFDLEVLKGARQLLGARKIKFILIEASFDSADTQHCSYQEINALLEPYGFKVHGFYNQNLFHGSTLMNYCDALFHLQPQG